MVERADVIVIGAGSAGEVCAGRAKRGVGRVVIVEAELAGGECSYWACMPSKVLLRPGEVLAAAARTPGAAGAVTGARVDVEATFKRRDEVVNGWDDRYQVQWLNDHGVEFVRGRGRLAGARRVVVNTPDGKDQDWEATVAVVLATGSSPVIPPIDGLDAAHPWTSREATSTKTVPRRLVVLGGGPVACEMAQAFRWLGSEHVTIVEQSARLLGHEEPFAADDLADGLRESGVDVRLGMTVERVRATGGAGGAHVVELADGDEFETDVILVATGRHPALDDVGLETVGLDPEALEVDAQLRVRGVDGDWLYAVGDCNGRSLLTHMGKYQGRVVGDVIAGRRAAVDRADDGVVPRVVFTDPQVASVGLTEAAAKEAGRRVRVSRQPMDGVGGVTVQSPTIKGSAQLVIDTDDDVIVGATFTGPAVADLLHSATIAIAARVPLAALADAVPAYPTPSEIWLHLLEPDG